MMRSFLVCYDIRNPKRLNKVYTTMRGYGEHLQYSVFLCELTKKLETEMRAELENIIDPEQDQILIIPLQHRVFFEVLGQPIKHRERELFLAMDGIAVDNDGNIQTEAQ